MTPDIIPTLNMIESALPGSRAEWRQLLRTTFTSGRGQIVAGHEALVYLHPDLPYVIKEFIRLDAMSGYLVAIDLIGDLMPQTQFIEGRQIAIRAGRHMIEKGLVQEKVTPLENMFLALVQAKSVTELKDLIKKKTTLDKEILRRGVYIQDPELKNYGMRKTGEVLICDPGRAVKDPSENSYHLTRIVNRGWTHYSIYMRLQDWGENALLGSVEDPHELSDFYRQETGLTFDPKINAATHLRLRIVGDMQDLAAFSGRTFGELAQEELEKYFPFKIPDHPGLLNFGTGYLDEWEEQNGRFVRKPQDK